MSERWCRLQDSNLRPPHYECDALPTELRRHRKAALYLGGARSPVKDFAGTPQMFQAGLPAVIE